MTDTRGVGGSCRAARYTTIAAHDTRRPSAPALGWFTSRLLAPLTARRGWAAAACWAQHRLLHRLTAHRTAHDWRYGGKAGCRLRGWGRRHDALRLREALADVGQGRALPPAEQPVLADFHEPLGQHVLQKPPQEAQRA